MPKNIFEYIKQEEFRYSQDIEVMENWNWCMKEHVENSLKMKHGLFIKGTNELEHKNPKRNIMLRFLKLKYVAEDIDVKDIEIYADGEDVYHLSFLVDKYHQDVYTQKHDLDTFFDDLKEEKIDMGGTLARYGAEGPIHETLDSIAFCDQTDLLSGPIGFKYFYSPDQILEKEALGWGKESNGADVTLEELVTLAEMSKQHDPNKGQKTDTPGKYIEVYRVHGSLPAHWLKDDPKNPPKEKYVRQIHIVAFYQNKDGFATGVTLYKKREYENPFKLHLPSRKLRNRALCYSGIEELRDPQIWTDYAELRKKELLDAASKIIPYTDDPTLQNRNQIRDMDQLELLTLQQGSQIGILQTAQPNVQLFNEWIREWDGDGAEMSGATEALRGKNPTSGTPFRLEALVTQNSQELHAYPRGKFATFIKEMYDDWFIPDMKKELANGAKFLSTLSADEAEYVMNCLVRRQVNKQVKDKIFSGIVVTQEEKQLMEEQARKEFQDKGSKHFIEILKDEMNEVPLAVKVNVAGKQRDLSLIVDKLTNVFRQVLVNPAVLDDPKAAKVFNKLIEYSGLEPIDFGYISPIKQEAQQPGQPQPQVPQPQIPQVTQPSPALV